MNPPNRIAEQEFVRTLFVTIAKALVDQSDDVNAEMREENARVTIKLKVADGDVGKLIGKQGRTARALRTILQAVGMKQGRHYSLDVRQETPAEPIVS